MSPVRPQPRISKISKYVGRHACHPALSTIFKLEGEV